MKNLILIGLVSACILISCKSYSFIDPAYFRVNTAQYDWSIKNVSEKKSKIKVYKILEGQTVIIIPKLMKSSVTDVSLEELRQALIIDNEKVRAIVNFIDTVK